MKHVESRTRVAKEKRKSLEVHRRRACSGSVKMGRKVKGNGNCD